MDYTMKGTLNFFPMSIYVNDNSMSNILSLKEVANSFHVKIDTKDDHAMISHFNKNKAYRLKECGNGLYYRDISDPETIPLTAKGTIYQILYFI